VVLVVVAAIVVNVAVIFAVLLFCFM
jgi:hypothetical protein